MKIAQVSQIKYVKEEDLAQMGMSRPEQRRLCKYFLHVYLKRIKQVSRRIRTRRLTYLFAPDDHSAGLGFMDHHHLICEDC